MSGSTMSGTGAGSMPLTRPGMPSASVRRAVGQIASVNTQRGTITLRQEPGVSAQAQDFVVDAKTDIAGSKSTDRSSTSNADALARLQALMPGDRVEISYIMQDGRLYAQRIEVQDGSAVQG